MNPKMTGLSSDNTDKLGQVSAVNDALFFAEVKPIPGEKSKNARWSLLFLVAVILVALLAYV